MSRREGTRRRIRERLALAADLLGVILGPLSLPSIQAWTLGVMGAVAMGVVSLAESMPMYVAVLTGVLTATVILTLLTVVERMGAPDSALEIDQLECREHQSPGGQVEQVFRTYVRHRGRRVPRGVKLYLESVSPEVSGLQLPVQIAAADDDGRDAPDHVSPFRRFDVLKRRSYGEMRDRLVVMGRGGQAAVPVPPGHYTLTLMAASVGRGVVRRSFAFVMEPSGVGRSEGVVATDGG